jgi:hypothetical protein
LASDGGEHTDKIKLTPSKQIVHFRCSTSPEGRSRLSARRRFHPFAPQARSPFRAAGAFTNPRAGGVHVRRPKGGPTRPARRAFTSTRLARAEGAAFTLTFTLASQCCRHPTRELLQFRQQIGSPPLDPYGRFAYQL